MARSRSAAAEPPIVIDPSTERAARRRGRDRALLAASLGTAALMFALALLHAGGH